MSDYRAVVKETSRGRVVVDRTADGSVGIYVSEGLGMRAFMRLQPEEAMAIVQLLQEVTRDDAQC